MLHIPSLFIASSVNRGRGVFTAEELSVDDIIEVAPVIEIPAKELTILENTILYNYYFSWGADLKGAAIALGYGSLYNHSDSPNVRFDLDFDAKQIIFIALSDIPAGAELLINYHEGLLDQTTLWFDVY